MLVNEILARYSSWSYDSAVAIYVLSMFFYLAEQVSDRSRARASVARELVTVGAVASPTDSVPEQSLDTESVDTGERSRSERLGRMGVALTVLAMLLHLSSIVLRGLATHRWPLGNMYEYMSFACLVAVVTWLVLLRKFDVRRLGGYLLLPVFILMFLGGTVLYTQAEPLQPALQSYWLWIHVTVITSATGVLMVSGVASVLYLLRSWHDHNGARLARLVPKLPAADTLDRLAYRSTIFGFPLFTFGVICGAIWAESAWSRFWGWDPKETTAFVAWVVYAAYLHSRATAGWRGNRAAAINTLGLGVMIFNLLFVNLVVTGLHSYAGVG